MRAAGLQTRRASHGFKYLQDLRVCRGFPLADFPISNTRWDTFPLNITEQRTQKNALPTRTGAAERHGYLVSAITGGQAGSRGGAVVIGRSCHCQLFKAGARGAPAGFQQNQLFCSPSSQTFL